MFAISTVRLILFFFFAVLFNLIIIFFFFTLIADKRISHLKGSAVKISMLPNSSESDCNNAMCWTSLFLQDLNWSVAYVAIEANSTVDRLPKARVNRTTSLFKRKKEVASPSVLLFQ